MLKVAFVALLLFTNAQVMAYIPKLYQDIAAHYRIDATALYEYALANAGHTNQQGNYAPWPWTVMVKQQRYQFPNRLALYRYLQQHNGNTQIRYGLGATTLHRQSDAALWQSLDIGTALARSAKHLRLQSRVSSVVETTQHLTQQPPNINSDLNQIIAQVAEQTGIEVALIKAVIAQESNFNIHARSHKGAMGLMQLMPTTAKGLGLNQSNFYDPYANVLAGATYLKQQIQAFGRIELALAAYNAGPHRVKQYGGVPPFKETQRYIPKVLQYYRQFGGVIDG